MVTSRSNFNASPRGETGKRTGFGSRYLAGFAGSSPAAGILSLDLGRRLVYQALDLTCLDCSNGPLAVLKLPIVCYGGTQTHSCSCTDAPCLPRDRCVDGVLHDREGTFNGVAMRVLANAVRLVR